MMGARSRWRCVVVGGSQSARRLARWSLEGNCGRVPFAAHGLVEAFDLPLVRAGRGWVVRWRISWVSSCS